jgi:predicted dehydrogenase
MRVLVLGAGMYVTGRGTPGDGTVLPALAQASRRHAIEEVVVAATKAEHANEVRACAERVNRKLGTQLRVRYDLADTALAERFDLAIVSVPDHLHHEIGSAVIERGMHCLMVKPLAPTLAEATALADLARDKDVYGAVELHKRWDEGNLVAKRLLTEGKIGALAYATVEYSQRRNVPLERFAAWSARTNIFQYLGVHYVDLMYFVTGYLPERACAIGARGVLAARGIDTWDAITASIVWRHGEARFVSQLTIGWIDPDGSSAISDQKYLLVGAEGRLELDQKRRGVELVTAAGVDTINPYFSQYLPTIDGGTEFAGYGPRSIYQFLDDVAAIRAGRVTPAELDATRPSFRDALVSTAVIEAVTESLGANSEWRSIRVPGR